jgi:hypothetical protein
VGRRKGISGKNKGKNKEERRSRRGRRNNGKFVP